MPRVLTPYEAAKAQNVLWTPALLGSSLEYWGALNTRDVPSPVSITSGAVDTWTSLAGKAQTLTNSTSSERPTLGETDIRRALSFSASQKLYTANSLASTDSLLVAVVASMSSTAPTSARLSSSVPLAGDDFNGTTKAVLLYREGTSQSAGLYYSNAAYSSVAVTYDRLSVYVFWMASLSACVRVNGTQGSSVTFSASLASQPVFIGGRPLSSTEGWGGPVREVVIAPALLTLAQVQQVEGTLAHKHGIAGNLIASHPYRNAPPEIGG